MATDTGSNYWLIGGGETPAPPVVQPTFGPVTRSGYAIAPVDPLSYYTPAPAPVETTPYTGAPTKWWEVYRPTPEPTTPKPESVETLTPDLSNVSTFTPLPTEQPSGGGGGGGASQPSPPAGPSTPSSQGSQTPYSADEVFPGFEGLRLGDPVPKMPGTRVGDYIVNDTGDVWNWRKGDWDYANPPRGDSYTRDDGAVVTPGGTSNVLPEQQKPTIILPPETVESTPVTQVQPITQQPIVTPNPQVTPTPPTTPETPTTPTTPTTPRVPITIFGDSVISRPVTPTPMPELPTVPTEITRKAPAALMREFRDINYDPEQILAAAMRGMGGRMARRSILNELS